MLEFDFSMRCVILLESLPSFVLNFSLFFFFCCLEIMGVGERCRREGLACVAKHGAMVQSCRTTGWAHQLDAADLSCRVSGSFLLRTPANSTTIDPQIGVLLVCFPSKKPLSTAVSIRSFIEYECYIFCSLILGYPSSKFYWAIGNR